MYAYTQLLSMDGNVCTHIIYASSIYTGSQNAAMTLAEPIAHCAVMQRLALFAFVATCSARL